MKNKRPKNQYKDFKQVPHLCFVIWNNVVLPNVNKNIFTAMFYFLPLKWDIIVMVRVYKARANFRVIGKSMGLLETAGQITLFRKMHPRQMHDSYPLPSVRRK